MKLETFFEKFELFADAPNAVGKMRELVLQLACSGRIANQDAADQPSSELLTEIFEVRDRFIKEGKGKSRVEGTMILAGDKMAIPSTWTRCMISEVCDLQTGATPSRQVSTYFGGDIPWLVSGDINRGEIHECEGRITDSGLRDSNCKLIPKNSVLIALNGQGKTRATVALLRIEAALNQSLVAMIPYSPTRLLPEYLFWNLRGRYYAIRDITGQDQRRGLNMKLVGQLSLPIPPLAEQKRIVARVEELMALCDRLEAQQQERDIRHAALARASLARFAEAPTPANLDFLFHKSYTITPTDLRKSILTLAVQGKLVPQDPSDEPAQELLAGMARRKTQTVKSGASKPIGRLRPISESDIPNELPESWVWVRAESICEVIVDCPHSTPIFVSSGVICLDTNSFKQGQLIPHKIRYVSEETYEERVRRLVPRAGDIVFAREGSVGESVIVSEGIRCCLGQRVMLFRLMPELSPQFVRMALSEASSLDRLLALHKGIGAKHVNVADMRNALLPLPPLAEQRRIVAKVDQLMALVDRLETQLSKAKIKSAALLDAVIHGLLNPTAEIIDLASYRAAIGCYAISKMQGKRYFGRTAAMKVLYLAQAHVGLELGLKPIREAAGPFDSWLYRFEEEGEREAWFKVVDDTTVGGKKKIEYRPGRALAEQSAQAERLFTVEQRKEFDRLLALFSDRTTEEAEIIATLFAAWNDFLIDGHVPSDDEIVREVRENWHEKKGRFTPVLLRKWLGWLRQNDLIPQGRAPRTAHQTQLPLN